MLDDPGEALSAQLLERQPRALHRFVLGDRARVVELTPVMVTPRLQPDGSERFMLMCGEGRLTAFRNLGEKTIPAFVVDVRPWACACCCCAVVRITELVCDPMMSFRTPFDSEICAL